MRFLLKLLGIGKRMNQSLNCNREYGIIFFDYISQLLKNI